MMPRVIYRFTRWLERLCLHAARSSAVTCLHCNERPANTTAHLCLPCEIELDRKVEAMEAHLDKHRAMRHYEALAAEAVGAS